MRTVFIIALNRMKIMIRNPLLIVLCVLLPFVFYTFTLKVMKSSEAGIRVPIAVVDLDESVSSKLVLDNIMNNESLECIVTEKNEAVTLLKKEKVQGAYILKKGFENKIINNKSNEIIDVYYLPGNKAAPVITDIIAGEIIPLICINKASNAVEKYYIKNNYNGKSNIKEDTKDLIFKKIKEKKYELPINISVRLPNDKENKDLELTQSVVFKQWILGMFLVFLSLYLVFNCSSIINERKSNLKKRIISSGCTYLEIVLGDLFGLVILGMLLNILQAVLFYLIMDMRIINIMYLFVVNLFFTYCIASILLCLTKFFKNTVSFQSFMPMFILFIGLIGGCFFNLEILPEYIKKISVFMPTYWAHEALSRLVLYHSGFNSILRNILVLFVYGTIFLVINYIMSLRNA